MPKKKQSKKKATKKAKMFYGWTLADLSDLERGEQMRPSQAVGLFSYDPTNEGKYGFKWKKVKVQYV